MGLIYFSYKNKQKIKPNRYANWPTVLHSAIVVRKDYERSHLMHILGGFVVLLLDVVNMRGMQHQILRGFGDYVSIEQNTISIFIKIDVYVVVVSGL